MPYTSPLYTSAIRHRVEFMYASRQALGRPSHIPTDPVVHW